MKYLIAIACLLGFALVAEACDPQVRFIAVHQKQFVPFAVNAPASITQFSTGPFGRVRNFQQINSGGVRGFNSGGSATQLQFGRFGRLKSFQQIN